MKNLEKFGVQELTTVEQRELEGGLHPIIIWFAAGIAYDILSNPSGSWDAFSSGYNAGRNR